MSELNLSDLCSSIREYRESLKSNENELIKSVIGAILKEIINGVKYQIIFSIEKNDPKLLGLINYLNIEGFKYLLTPNSHNSNDGNDLIDLIVFIKRKGEWQNDRISF